MSKLTELREMCERLGIEWHHRHKEATLAAKIAEHADTVVVETAPETDPAPVMAETAVAKRDMPTEVREALEYFNSHKRCNARVVREFIESIL